nr:uncharacterized protein LOC114920982 [Labrus bergylta]
MRVPPDVAAVSCLCPLVIFLCVVSQSCCGIRVSLNPHITYPNTSLYPHLGPKSQPGTIPLPSSSPEEDTSPLRSSQLSSSRQNLRSKPQLKPWDLTSNYRSNTNSPSEISKTSSNSDTELKPHIEPKLNFISQQGSVRNISNNPKQSAEWKPRIRSQPSQKPRTLPKSPVGTRTSIESESGPVTKLTTLSSLNHKSNSSGSVRSSTAKKPSPASLSRPKSHARLRSPSQTNAKITNQNSKSQRNQTKSVETDKDPPQRPRRGWIWNQFFVLEEHIGPEPQYVGKPVFDSRNGSSVIDASRPTERLMDRGAHRLS